MNTSPAANAAAANAAAANATTGANATATTGATTGATGATTGATGATTGAATGAAEERRISSALASASDGALTRVVALIDAMDCRHTADRLLDRARSRLRQLRPPRPLQFVRLLFLPLDGAIVPASVWRRGEARVPRSTLVAIASLLRAAAPEAVGGIVADCGGHSFADTAVVSQLGRRLWAVAATLPPETPPPADWAATTGLRPMDMAPILSLCCGVWRHAGPLWDAVEAAAQGPPEALVRAALNGPAAEAPAVFLACLQTLMERAAQPAQVAAAASRIGGPARQAADQALDQYLGQAATRIETAEPHVAADLAERLAGTLGDLLDAAASRGGEARTRLGVLRHGIDQACRTAFTTGLEARLLAPASRLAGPASDAEVEELERAARNLRRLEMAGRRIGGDAVYDQALRSVSASLATLPPATKAQVESLSRIERARLVEILCGAEAARQSLNLPP